MKLFQECYGRHTKPFLMSAVIVTSVFCVLAVQHMVYERRLQEVGEVRPEVLPKCNATDVCESLPKCNATDVCESLPKCNATDVCEALPKCNATEAKFEVPPSVSLAEDGVGMELNSDPEAVLLYQQWEYLYFNRASTTLPEAERTITMADVGVEKQIAHAPHLQDCPALDCVRREREEMLPGGEYPAWVDMEEGNVPGKNPSPPWIRGSDYENSNFLRVVQRDLWLQQHPRDCRDPSVKFAIILWRSEMASGLGSQLHVMSTHIGKVLGTGRVIVTGPWNRAKHDGCEGADYMRLDCYFRGFVSDECVQVALEELSKQPDMKQLSYAEPWADDRFVKFGEWEGEVLPKNLLERWGGAEKWVNVTSTSEMGGRLWTMNRPQVYQKWWHSQTAAYIFRWPSQRLCRVVNKARHQAYGMAVARNVMAATRERKRLDQGQPLFSSVIKNRWTGDTVLERGTGSLDTHAWLEEEPYIPRPLLSMHVRQGDKGKEMQLFQLRDFMWSAERLRLHVPDLRHVWLSTEMETVLKESEEYTPRWQFMYTQAHRMVGNKLNIDYEVESGVRDYVDHSFANLMISSEADYFVGTLASNWNRLLDELRKTRGRLRKGYITLNDDEW